MASFEPSNQRLGGRKRQPKLLLLGSLTFAWVSGVVETLGRNRHRNGRRCAQRCVCAVVWPVVVHGSGVVVKKRPLFLWSLIALFLFRLGLVPPCSFSSPLFLFHYKHGSTVINFQGQRSCAARS